MSFPMLDASEAAQVESAKNTTPEIHLAAMKHQQMIETNRLCIFFAQKVEQMRAGIVIMSRTSKARMAPCECMQEPLPTLIPDWRQRVQLRLAPTTPIETKIMRTVTNRHTLRIISFFSSSFTFYIGNYQYKIYSRLKLSHQSLTLTSEALNAESLWQQHPHELLELQLPVPVLVVLANQLLDILRVVTIAKVFLKVLEIQKAFFSLIEEIKKPSQTFQTSTRQLLLLFEESQHLLCLLVLFRLYTAPRKLKFFAELIDFLQLAGLYLWEKGLYKLWKGNHAFVLLIEEVEQRRDNVVRGSKIALGYGLFEFIEANNSALVGKMIEIVFKLNHLLL